MANKTDFGALGTLTRDEFDDLSLGVQSINKPLQVFGRSIPSSTSLTAPLGLFTGLSTPLNIGTAIGAYKSQSAADKFLNKPDQDRSFFETAKRVGTGVQEVKDMIPDLDGDNIISNYEMNKFGQNIRGLDLAPMYTGGDETNMVKGAGGKTMPFGATANPYSSGSFTERTESRAGSADGKGSIYDLQEQGRFEEAQDLHDLNLKSTSDYAADAINQTNITNYDPTKGTYDPNFAKAVTRENQEAQGTDGGGDVTYICTALYEMGDMKKYIYKYDHLYGRKVHPATYRGYALWGEPLARQIKKKGIVYKIIKPIALTWANQMAYDLSKGKHGKDNKAMKIAKTIGEGICYTLGQIFKRRKIWLISQ